MTRRIILDLEKCYSCEECTVECEYDFRQGMNNGALRMQELAMYASICRQCEESPCTVACPEEAIDKGDDGLLVRHLMRCTGCKTCTMACPFGCRYPEIVGYKTPTCDLCADRVVDWDPKCVASCGPGAISVADVEADPAEGIFIINEHWAVKAKPWQKVEQKK